MKLQYAAFGDVLTAPVTPGDLVGEKYRVGRTLGSGGMGVVVAATHLELGRPVALKFLHPEAAQDAEATSRFLREARAAAALRSEHVVRVLDVGRHGALPYIVMEHLEGADLGALLEREGAFPPERAVDWLLEAGEALAEAHARGIVHRDLKPANLFVARRPDGAPLVKVLDFGISKLATSHAASSLRLTKPRAMMGSPAYMAPEQMLGAASVDARADVWSLGVILYELLTGRQPFTGASLVDLGLRVVNEPHAPVTGLAPHVPAPLARAIDRCLSKGAAQRFAHMAALADALAPFGSEAARASAARIAGVLGLRAPGTSTPAPAAATSPGLRRRALAAGALLGLGLAGGAAWLGMRPPPPPAAPVAPQATGAIAPSNVAEVPPASAAAPRAPEPPPPPRARAAPEADGTSSGRRAGAAQTKRPRRPRATATTPAPEAPADAPAAPARAIPTRRGPIVTDL